MDMTDFFRAIEEIAKEKNIEAQEIYTKIEEALVKAAKSEAKAPKYAAKAAKNSAQELKNEPEAEKEAEKTEASAEKEEAGAEKEGTEPNPVAAEDIQCIINPQAKGEDAIRIFRRKTVVAADEDVRNEAAEMSVGEAQKYKPGAVAGDIVEVPLHIANFGRVAAQKVKSVLRQGIRDIEKAKVLKDLQSNDQEIATATVQTVDSKENLILKIRSAEVILPKKEQIPGKKYEVGQTLKVYIYEVKTGENEKGPKALISETHPNLVKRLFEQEVSEIQDGIIEVKGISREAGSRTKISVYSKDANIDPVGSCIGPRGSRVNSIVSELGGEKIDIVKYSENPAEYIAAALAPAEILSVDILSETEKSCQVTVPDTQLSLAIGNKGQNVRLAARLTGWKIDIKPESGFYQPTIKL